MYLEIPLMVIFLFTLKHLICDFLFQPPYMFLNKGILLHPGGLFHAIVNGIGTAIVLVILFPQISGAICLMLSLIELLIHYFVDYAKVKINTINHWEPHTSPNYWFSLGIDQTAHYMSYLLIVYLVITSYSMPELIGILIIVMIGGAILAAIANVDKA